MADPANNAVVGEPEVRGEAGLVGKGANTPEQTPITDNKGEKQSVEEATNCEREGKQGDNMEGVTGDNSNTSVESEEPPVVQIQEEMSNVAMKPQSSPSLKRADVKGKSEPLTTNKAQSKKIEVNKRDIVTVKKVETRGKNEARPSSGNRSGKITPQKQSPQKGKADGKGQMLLSSRASQQYSRNPKNPWNKPASPEGLHFVLLILRLVCWLISHM